MKYLPGVIALLWWVGFAAAIAHGASFLIIWLSFWVAFYATIAAVLMIDNQEPA